MERYRLRLKKSAAKEIEKLPKKDCTRLVGAIQNLLNDPYGQNAQKLSGQEKYRIRVGNYRVLYEIINNDLVIVVVKVGHRKDVYRN
ncbi:type II toxin-antitoxin system RelE/ParE family toxin [Opitutales bacterium]|jgi:mRNA interferase RelE/StbE|nr:type II toxin-antitoxin system RelE/ParE family toxin [Opitutales bacterium]